YSPELNPTEQVWRSVKKHGVGRKTIFGPDQLKSSVVGCLRRLQKVPRIILSFFKDPYCRYVLTDV
ncbi:MAG: IS630 family transposase, partial [Candidatus Helarchaeota archaeon]